MATYYVRKAGSDAAAGTSAGAAWLTIGKALGASGIASGDTVYIGAGVYREAVTVNMTSATVETSVIGDVDGAQTGDAGDVVLSAYTVNDWVASGSVPLTLNGRDFLTFRKIILVGGTAAIISAATKSSTNIVLQDLTLKTHPNGLQSIQFTPAANVALNLTIDRCTFLKDQYPGLQLTIDTPATADFNVNVLVTNCIFIGGTGNCIQIEQGLTTNTFKFGGVTAYNCTHIGSGSFMRAMDTNHSTSIPSNVYGCACLNPASTSLQAFASGQLVEDYNFLPAPTPRSNVTAGAHSVTHYAPQVEIGEAAVTGRLPRPFGMPTVASPLMGFGVQAGGPTVDLLNRPRPSGMRLAAFGTATAGAAKTMTDAGATWGVNAWAGYTLQITGGTGSGQTKSIASNTATVITADGNWKTNPDATSTYQVYWGDPSSTGTATAGTTTSLTDSNAAWGVNQWSGYILHIDTGTGSGQSLTITSNTATVLSFATATAPDATSTYSLYKATGITTQDYAVGAYERHDHAQREVTVTDAGGVGLVIMGTGDQDIRVPVNATNTTVSIKTRWHATATNKPQAQLLANGEIGVAAETITASGVVDTWETLTFSDFTPTSKGVVMVRIVSRPDASADLTYFDTMVVT